MSELFKKYKDLEEFYVIIDLFCSEYGWSIEYIQNITIPEVYCLLRCILKRKGVKEENIPGHVEKETENLIKLAKTLGASKNKLDDLKSGKKIIL